MRTVEIVVVQHTRRRVERKHIFVVIQHGRRNLNVLRAAVIGDFFGVGRGGRGSVYHLLFDLEGEQNRVAALVEAFTPDIVGRVAVDARNSQTERVLACVAERVRSLGELEHDDIRQVVVVGPIVVFALDHALDGVAPIVGQRFSRGARLLKRDTVGDGAAVNLVDAQHFVEVLPLNRVLEDLADVCKPLVLDAIVARIGDAGRHGDV